MKMSELLVSMTCIGILALYTVPTALRIGRGGKGNCGIASVTPNIEAISLRCDRQLRTGQIRCDFHWRQARNRRMSERGLWQASAIAFRD